LQFNPAFRVHVLLSVVQRLADYLCSHEKQLNTAKESIRLNFKRRSKSNRRLFGAIDVTLNEIFKVQYCLELVGKPVVPSFKDLEIGEPSTSPQSGQASDAQPSTTGAFVAPSIEELTPFVDTGTSMDENSVQNIATPQPTARLSHPQQLSPRPLAAQSARTAQATRTSTQPLQQTPEHKTSASEPPGSWPLAHGQSMVAHGRSRTSLPSGFVDRSQVTPPASPYRPRQLGFPIARELRDLYRVRFSHSFPCPLKPRARNT
jgi:hypothetical protein